MEPKLYEIEKSTPFSESQIWQFNRDYYINNGIEAWKNGTVPHHLTSNSLSGKTYAELIFGFLKDLAYKGQSTETVYILELGAGHGRMAFHILKHLERLCAQVGLDLPPFCYVLSDIVEKNLSYFESHPQFQYYFENGMLEYAHYDAVGGDEILLRYSSKTISKHDLKQPLLVLANYFFDSIPKDLFFIKEDEIHSCQVSLSADRNPDKINISELLEAMSIDFTHHKMGDGYYENKVFNEILEKYPYLLKETYLFFPHIALKCLENLQQLSSKGIALITMDKGFSEIRDLENKDKPEMITHGSMSFHVNFHAFIAYCDKMSGTAYFPKYSTFHLQLGCLLFLENSASYYETKAAYNRVVNEYGPDDFNSYKHFSYKHIARMNLPEMISLLRLSAYDSSIFKNILPRLKQLAKKVSFNDRNRLAQTMDQTWNMYFVLEESKDLAFEIAGLLYSLGYYEKALVYFQYSVNHYGHTEDEYYNRILCYYQLRQDHLFIKTLKEAKTAYPTYERYKQLDQLDLNAA